MLIVQARCVLVGVIDTVALVLLRPDAETMRRDLTTPTARIAAIGADRVVAQVVGAGLWLLALWVAIGLLAVCGAGLPGACGRFAALIGRLVVPRVVASLLAGSVGVGVLLAPAAAGAVPSPVWPSVPATHSSSSPVPAPVWPGSSSPSAAPVPSKPVQPAAPHRAAPADQVRAGDSLWLLAARRLGPTTDDHAIAEYWPQIYAANRAVIGTNPSLITPGQHLHMPAPTAQESTS